MQHNLEAALSFINRYPQAHLFPAFWSVPTKRHISYIKWGSGNSNDPEKVKQWAAWFPDCYFCVDLRPSGKSNLSVLDIDNKHGKSGDTTLLDHELNGKTLPKTLVTSTPSGGYHRWGIGSCKSTVGRKDHKLGEGLDTPVMVPVPGSNVPGKGEYKIIKDRPIAPQASWIVETAGQVVERETPLDDFEYDKPHDITRATRYLENAAPEAVENDGGDRVTFQIACELREYGVSPAKTAELMLTHWNDAKAHPPWSPQEIQEKANNADKYGTGRPGGKSLDAIFTPEKRSKGRVHCAFDIRAEEIPPRRWLVKGRYAPGYVTATIAPPGVGKSLLSLAEGVAIACGKGIAYGDIAEKGPVWVYNTEDPLDELKRRIAAIKRHFKLTASDIEDFYFSSGYDNPFKLAALDDRGRPVANETEIKKIIKDIKARSARLFTVDPLVQCHSLVENNNDHMNFLVGIFKRIAHETDCAVHVVHHTNKGKHEHGNSDAARGASAIIGAVRIGHTFYNMTPKEAGGYGVAPGDIEWYTRLSKAKANMSPPNKNALWFKKYSVQIQYDDDETTGVVAPVQMEKVTPVEVDELLISTMFLLMENTSERSFYALANDIFKMSIVELSVKQLQRRLTAICKEPVVRGLRALRPVKTSGKNGKPVDGVSLSAVKEV